MTGVKVRVDSPRLRYTDDFIEAEYEYQTTSVTETGDENDDKDVYTVSVYICPSVDRSIGYMLAIIATCHTKRADSSPLSDAIMFGNFC